VNQERTAAYPGSFDPIINGHIDIIRCAAQLVRLNELRQHPSG
jgi:phosphopantetheine adenylyltransferase